MGSPLVIMGPVRSWPGPPLGSPWTFARAPAGSGGRVPVEALPLSAGLAGGGPGAARSGPERRPGANIACREMCPSDSITRQRVVLGVAMAAVPDWLTHPPHRATNLVWRPQLSIKSQDGNQRRWQYVCGAACMCMGVCVCGGEGGAKVRQRLYSLITDTYVLFGSE